MFHTGIDGITSTALTKLAIYVTPVSVSGSFHALRIVGSVANPSPSAANKIANVGEDAKIQIMIAKSEQAPQRKSNVVNFQ